RAGARARRAHAGRSLPRGALGARRLSEPPCRDHTGAASEVTVPIQIGDALPSATLHEGSPGNKVDPAQALGKGKVLIFAVPGAFTPGCSKTHLPGYVANRDALAAKGIDT